jgi:FOG: EAL domain
MGVNVSIKQLQTQDIVGQVCEALEESGLNPGSLELEITENVLLREVSAVLEVLNELKSIGVLISIDDFGTEYASLNYLKHMPVDRIKIAMPFVQGLDESEKDQAITKSLIILAKNMGISVIAEGVETESQLDFLTNRLCDETQGFYLYRPMPATEIEKLLQDTKIISVNF